MSRYFTRPRAANFVGDGQTSNDPLLPGLTVDDHVAVHTGLVDQRGDPIMRAPRPVGFGRGGEW